MEKNISRKQTIKHINGKVLLNVEETTNEGKNIRRKERNALCDRYNIVKKVVIVFIRVKKKENKSFVDECKQFVKSTAEYKS